MKTKALILGFFAISFIAFTSCEKEESFDDSKVDAVERSISELTDDVSIEKGEKYEKVIVNPLQKLQGCKFIVAGTIDYLLDGELVATVDFGDGTCDNIATKTIDGKSFEFKLSKKGKKDRYDKVIIEPIVKLEDCDYIVQGIVELWKADKLVVTIDFGDGTCDKWATKTWDGGSKQFELKKRKH